MVWGLAIFPHQNRNFLNNNTACLLQKPREGNRENSWLETEAVGNHLLEKVHEHTSSFFIHVKKTFIATGTLS